jgi:ATP-binding cassette subfamily B protein
MLGSLAQGSSSGSYQLDVRAVVPAVIWTAVLFSLGQVLLPVQRALFERVKYRVDGKLIDRVMICAMRPTGLQLLEDQRFLSDLSKAASVTERDFTFGSACAGLISLVARYTQLVCLAIVVGVRWSPLAAVGLCCVTLTFRHAQRGGLHQFGKLFGRKWSAQRTALYMRDLATSRAVGKEVRVFALSLWLQDRYRAAQLTWLKPMWQERRRIYLWPWLRYAVTCLIVAAVILTLLGRAGARGSIDVTSLALVMQAVVAAVRLGDFYPEADMQTEWGMFAYEALRSIEVQARAEGIDDSQPCPVHEPLDSASFDVQFTGIRFSYQGSSQPVFENLEIKIPAGQSLGVVGLNGAGKTTLVKLLARFYDPTAGNILAGETDIRSLDPREWRRKLAIVFQDFNHYESSVYDNVALGAVERYDDREGVIEALDRAGALPFVTALPHGLDTILSPRRHGGVDLSGGQWQRIAIARALFAVRAGASIVVLDEPTANLDVRAETAFFQNFSEIVTGVTTILISHRLASVRHADSIIVLERAAVIEQGTHESLLELGGRYAELFNIQAIHYQS